MVSFVWFPSSGPAVQEKSEKRGFWKCALRDSHSLAVLSYLSSRLGMISPPVIEKWIWNFIERFGSCSCKGPSVTNDETRGLGKWFDQKKACVSMKTWVKVPWDPCQRPSMAARIYNPSAKERHWRIPGAAMGAEWRNSSSSKRLWLIKIRWRVTWCQPLDSPHTLVHAQITSTWTHTHKHTLTH